MDPELAGTLNLTDEEISYLEQNPMQENLAELMEEVGKFRSLKSEKLKLQSEYARMNFEIYDTFMSTHQNAIAISGMFSEIRIGGNEIDREKIEKIEYFLDRYLIINGLE